MLDANYYVDVPVRVVEQARPGTGFLLKYGE